MIIEEEYVCLYPFVVVHWRCDTCGRALRTNPDGTDICSIVTLEDGRTICKPCLWVLACES